MLLHDATDVLMEAAKSCSYAGAESAAAALFAAFVLVWAALRLAAYPLLVLRSTLWELPRALGPNPPLYLPFNAGLVALWGFNCYWSTLIWRVLRMQLSTGATQDVREEDSDEG